MKKSFITREYSSEPQPGTLNQKESRVFFSSKILEIEDVITIDDNNITWTQSTDNTQGLGVDSVNKILDTTTLKLNDHTLRIFPNQSDQDKKNFTQWEFTFNITDMITQYLFALLKKNRTFTGITNINTKFNDIDRAINDYINFNILPRIQFDTVVLFIKYYPVGEKQENGVVALQFDSQFRVDIINPVPLAGENNTDFQNRVLQVRKSLTAKNFQLTLNASQTVATVIYKQTQSSSSFKFDYYFNIVYKKA